MKILVVTPKFPFPIMGASESDRAYGIKQLMRLGFDVKVISKIPKDKLYLVDPVAKKLGIDFYPITYKFSKNKWQALRKYIKIAFTKPTMLDGAAYEYSDKEIVDKFKEINSIWQPDYIWFDMSFMWHLIKYVNRKKTKVITRSQAFEASHFIEEEGMSFKNFIVYFAKFYSEKRTVKLSDLILAITPEERDMYKKLGAKHVEVLPLRGLPYSMKDSKEIKEKFPLNVFFAGSTYGVQHNKKALEFLLKEIIPQVNKQAKDKFVFHILGRKFPDAFKQYVTSNVKVLGFVSDYEQLMKQMDIALIPALAGRGMQQKIFEPLARGIPVVATPRGLAGYPFKNDQHLLYAKTAEDFVDNLLKLQDVGIRDRLSKEAINLSKELFTKEILDKQIIKAINKL